MPELPEVETVIRGLRKTIAGETIARVTHKNAPPATIVVSQSFRPRKLGGVLKNRRIQNITRRGKNILIALSGDITLWIHLKMTGHCYYMDRRRPVAKHDLVIIDFDSSPDTGMHFRFNDYRRFGRLRLYPNSELWEQPGLDKLGPEPLEITAADFVALLRSHSRMIKPALLDQNFLVGLGNIYADESLYAARIHPRRMTDSISKKKLIELRLNIQRLLNLSIRKMGTTVDSYSAVNGQTGQFQSYLKAYDNEGNPCAFCGRKIVREKIGSRSAHFCPRCQRL
jgi:formamidopyrimidine-DNA glycosylase